MKAQIKNFMGCLEGEINISRIAILTGRNHQGKSSICRAIACALSGQTIPLGLRKTDAGMLVHTGADRGEIVLSVSSGTTSVVWPKSERHTDGQAPHATVYAVGLSSLIDLNAKDRVDLLQEILNQQPTREDLFEFLKDAEMRVNILEALWKRIELDGWDTTLESVRRKGSDFKAQWGYVSGENYGSRKADSWVPDGWDETLAPLSLETLQDRVTLARAELDDAIAMNAVSQSQIDELKLLASELDQSEILFREEKKKLHELEAALNAKKDERTRLPACSVDSVAECPACKVSLVVDRIWKGRTTLKLADDVPDKERDERQKKRAELDGTIQNLQHQLNEQKNVYHKARQNHEKACDAQNKLVSLPARKTDQKAGADVDEKRRALANLEQQLNAFQKKSEADKLHRNVKTNQTIIDALDQKGVRKTALKRALKLFNKELERCSGFAGFGKIAITDDLELELNGRNYTLLSESEQYRLRSVVQVVISKLDGSECLVLDAAEVLDPKGRAGLIKMLHQMDVHAVVGMMMSKPESAPNLKSANVGHVYWVEAGKTREVTHKGAGHAAQ